MKIKIRQIIQIIQEELRQVLNEGAMGPADLPPDIFVKIEPDQHGVTITYARSSGNVWLKTNDDNGNEIAGEVRIVAREVSHWDWPGQCGNAWVVGHSEASHGWGPMLYDVAMEYATLNGGGLIADRGSVSRAAREVWNYYFWRNDVMAHQLDDPHNTLTPEEEDNCNQEVAGYELKGKGNVDSKVDWTRSPLSKRYTKPPTTIEMLKTSGKLVWLSGGTPLPRETLKETLKEMIQEELSPGNISPKKIS
jgi:hypothetical protein